MSAAAWPDLCKEAAELAARIQEPFEELGA